MKTGYGNFHCKRIYCGNQDVSAGAGGMSDSLRIFGPSGQCSLWDIHNLALRHNKCTKGMHTPYSVLCTFSRMYTLSRHCALCSPPPATPRGCCTVGSHCSRSAPSQCHTGHSSTHYTSRHSTCSQCHTSHPNHSNCFQSSIA